jgi:hypothetical protein
MRRSNVLARASLVVLVSLAVAAPAMAKPSDWADVIERPGDRASLPSARNNAAPVVTKASASKPKKERITKAKAKAKAKKAKKAPRRGKVKRGRR